MPDALLKNTSRSTRSSFTMLTIGVEVVLQRRKAQYQFQRSEDFRNREKPNKETDCGINLYL